MRSHTHNTLRVFGSVRFDQFYPIARFVESSGGISPDMNCNITRYIRAVCNMIIFAVAVIYRHLRGYSVAAVFCLCVAYGFVIFYNSSSGNCLITCVDAHQRQMSAQFFFCMSAGGFCQGLKMLMISVVSLRLG